MPQSTNVTKAGRIAACGGNRALVNRAELHRPGPLGFDPSRIVALLGAIAPLCAVIADYVTKPGPIHERHDRIIGRVGGSGECPPYLTWGHLCDIEDAAYALAREVGDADFLHAIAIEARSDATGTGAAEGKSAGLKGIARD